MRCLGSSKLLNWVPVKGAEKSPQNEAGHGHALCVPAVCSVFEPLFLGLFFVLGFGPDVART